MSEPTPGAEPTSAAAPPTQSTGEPRVDAALGRLATLDELPVAEHVGVYDEVNRLLQDALADLDEER